MDDGSEQSYQKLVHPLRSLRLFVHPKFKNYLLALLVNQQTYNLQSYLQTFNWQSYLQKVKRVLNRQTEFMLSTTRKIPKKSNPPKSEDVSRKNLFEFNVHSKSKFLSTTSYPVQDFTTAQKVTLKKMGDYGEKISYCVLIL